MLDEQSFRRGVKHALGLYHLRVEMDRLVSWFYIRRIWGDRCRETMPGCPTCDKWAEHDEIFNGRPLVHASDCATSNGPAYKTGPCDCGAKAGR